MNSAKTSTKICVVSFPWKSYAPYKFLSDLLRILEPITDKIVLIDGNTDQINIPSKKVEVRDIGISIHYLKDIKPTFYSATLWLTKCILAQIKISLELIKARKDVDVVIYYMAYPYYLLPLITSKILGKKTIDVVTRSKTDSFVSKIVGIQDVIFVKLLDGISPESKSLIRELGLEKYNNKLLPEGARFIDTSRYTIKKKISERKNIVGFIGRIRKEKGIEEFIRAIPIIAKEIKDVEFIIGGSGDMLDWTRTECKKIEHLHGIRITITGFIAENKLANYFNELKLLILPTMHSEGLPTSILEAMACGTPVLATPVGGIPDVLKDEITGFILENNTPQCIADNVMDILKRSDLEIIVNNARKLINENFTYDAAVKRYTEILSFSTEFDDLK